MTKPTDLIALLLVLVLIPAVSFAQEPVRLSEAVRTLDAAGLGQPAAPPAKDSLLNGTLIGAAVGFGAGYLTMAAVNAKATDSGPIWDQDARGYYTMAGIIGAGIGAGIGALVDALRKGPRRSQRQPGTVVLTPIHTRGHTGAVVSVRY